jgi:hypothetical protein
VPHRLSVGVMIGLALGLQLHALADCGWSSATAEKYRYAVLQELRGNNRDRLSFA